MKHLLFLLSIPPTRMNYSVTSKKIREHAVEHRGAFIHSHVSYGISLSPEVIEKLHYSQGKYGIFINSSIFLNLLKKHP